jgi:hypothetical protein
MDEFFQLDESIFHEDESLTDRMRRVTPKIDMTNASLTAVCGSPPIPIHSQDDDARWGETVMFNILVTLIDIPDQNYVGSACLRLSRYAHSCKAESNYLCFNSCTSHQRALPLHICRVTSKTEGDVLIRRSLHNLVRAVQLYQTNPCPTPRDAEVSRLDYRATQDRGADPADLGQ